MGNMNQIDNVKTALDLSNEIIKTKSELDVLESEEFRTRPVAPEKRIAQKKYPEIKSTVKINWALCLLPMIVFLPWPIIYYLLIYKKSRDEDIERIRNSDSYKKECAKIDEEFNITQKENEERYAQEKQEYDEIIIPQYESERNAWLGDMNNKKSAMKKALNNMQESLSSHFEETKIVPLQYRSVEALQYIYDVISTSDCSIKEAIELYDKKKQRELDAARLYEQQEANRLADEQNRLAQEQNELLDRQNSIADRARREANAASVVGTIQRHNTNKAINRLNK